MVVEEIRQSQFILQGAVGALRNNEKRIYMITSSLDNWLNPKDEIDLDDLTITEHRLRHFLGVDRLVTPPELIKNPFNFTYKNVIKAFRFPNWHYCNNSKCRRMIFLPKEISGQKRCDYCNEGKSERSGWPVYQMSLVAACPNGHLDDFPWKDWCHRQYKSSCNGNLTFVTDRGKGTGNRKIKCSCGKYNDLSGFGIIEDQIKGFKCTGRMPWTKSDKHVDCAENMRGIFRSSNSVYSSILKSSIYIPLDIENEKKSDLLVFLDNPKYLTTLNGNIQKSKLERYQIDKQALIKRTVEDLSDLFENDFLEIDMGDLEDCIRYILFNEEVEEKDSGSSQTLITDEDYMVKEYEVLSTDFKNKEIECVTQDMSIYSNLVQQMFSEITLVNRLRETKALVGFSRVRPNTNFSIKEGKEQLWEDLEDGSDFWIPAYKTYGEGIFFKLNSENLNSILSNNSTNDRINEMFKQLIIQKKNGFINDEINLKFVIAHTLSHILINEFSYFAGYSSTSMSEKIYVNINQDSEMNGFLIYTAAGDSEGTLGGLVQLGLAENLDKILFSALSKSQWCSTDPVCNEGLPQGPFGLNLGACHACVLLPETSCNHRNSYLDRGVVTGTIENRQLGYVDISKFQ